MSGQEGAGLPPDRWMAESFRYTCFLSGEGSLEDVPWWQEIVGRPSEAVNLDRKNQTRLEHGPFEGGMLVLGMAGPRVDWVWKARESGEEAEAGQDAALGPFPATVAKFAEVIRTWFGSETCPTAKRVALGYVLLQPVADRVSGYRTLRPYLERYVKIDAEGSSDLVYNINRRRPSRSDFEGLQLNRLSKWMVRVTRAFAVGLSLSPTGSRQQQKLGPQRFACCLELDLNTAPEYAGVFTPPQQSVVFEELRKAALEIAEKGDIA